MVWLVFNEESALDVAATAMGGGREVRGPDERDFSLRALREEPIHLGVYESLARILGSPPAQELRVR